MPAAAALYVKDLARMSAFYEQCFGITRAEVQDGTFQLRDPVRQFNGNSPVN